VQQHLFLFQYISFAADPSMSDNSSSLIYKEDSDSPEFADNSLKSAKTMGRVYSL